MKLTGINQLWVADITYIRLKTEFVYLAVILDGYSRKVVGWVRTARWRPALPSEHSNKLQESDSQPQAWYTIRIAGSNTRAPNMWASSRSGTWSPA